MDIKILKKNLGQHSCVCCGSKKKLTIDHIIPKSKGGGNHIANYQILCQPCNIAKANAYPEYKTDEYFSLYKISCNFNDERKKHGTSFIKGLLKSVVGELEENTLIPAADLNLIDDYFNKYGISIKSKARIESMPIKNAKKYVKHFNYSFILPTL